MSEESYTCVECGTTKCGEAVNGYFVRMRAGELCAVCIMKAVATMARFHGRAGRNTQFCAHEHQKEAG